ncbi:hypothetical protein F4V57_14260 [Acinetobacter qingfengensis]|uniref:Uncharacterized protein n=1 Tax=Acinetobacter qingfengensis TaxID=1262585 RepID=A0A1E7QYP0_9GAMM|nr:hypothetical protein [Acinetobacter qingfengensis]KAA8731012.1 hypothetical protein F4V57_14260 [Acinetobacter qingfengensis]OEY92208.1 hypothetical protein BJI46_05505 [Acinetobacter qingfengensis]
MFDSFDFPDAPTYKAQWKPVYFEPIVNSGERITILIVVKTGDNYAYYETLHESVIDNLYGSKSLPFKNLIKYIKSQIDKNNGELNNCIEGVHDGSWSNASSLDAAGIARQGLKRTASLGTLAMKELFNEEEKEQDVAELNWGNKIKQEFLKTHPAYEKSFNHSVAVSKNVKIKCGFHSARYAAKFNVCTVKTISRVKTSLMDLQILEDHGQSNKLDLILFVPNADGLLVTKKMRDKMNEHILLLKEQCKDSTIEIVSCASEKQGSDRLSTMLNVA